MTETRQLIVEAQKGDQQALNQLFSKWYHRVYNIAYKYFSDTQKKSRVTYAKKAEPILDSAFPLLISIISISSMY